ncbi:MAG: 4Fe-4S binding protein [Candidatus Gastranaerophilales bacterium]|nr:4Fe-4S binding protein [Candidatus Gastranaerophilales bacterium]
MSYIKINQDKCKSCYLCMDVCPKKLIKKSEKIGKTGQNVAEFIDTNNECLGCSQCALVCPDIAITEVVKE